jgi:23S rRNA pseudouridine2605 synthase
MVKMDHIVSIGRLDYNSEGLMILTNNGDLARQLEMPKNQVKRIYKVRVFGILDDKKLDKIRQVHIINKV